MRHGLRTEREDQLTVMRFDTLERHTVVYLQQHNDVPISQAAAVISASDVNHGWTSCGISTARRQPIDTVAYGLVNLISSRPMQISNTRSQQTLLLY